MKERVLILDDEASMLSILERYVGALEHGCLTCGMPNEALAAMKPGAFALLITDLRMPEMDGMEVLRRAREIDGDLAVIVVTALADVNTAIHAMRAGADDYVVKPFTFADLALSVSNALEKRARFIKARKHNQELERRVHRATEDLELANRELRETKQYLENLIQSTVDGIITVDKTGKIEFANDGAHELLGYGPDLMLGRPAAHFFAGGSDEVRLVRRRLRADNRVNNYETELKRADGSLVPVNMSLSFVPAHDGGVASILAICKDITEQKRLEEELKEMSIKDSLTGLFNQRYFYDRLKAEIERARRQKHPLSLLLLDIDQFKSYNDTFGHLEGDRVIQTMGKVVVDCTRTSVDIGFRYGGDEFTIILPEADQDQAQQIAERIRKGFEARKFDRLTLSIGLMSYREGDSLRGFISSADAAMYDAKRSGGNSVFIYHAGDEVDHKDEREEPCDSASATKSSRTGTISSGPSTT